MDLDEPVFVIDLTRAAIDRAARKAAEPGPARPRPLPEAPTRPIERIALLLDGWQEPLLLPVAPTADVVLLDALGRLLTIGVLAGERVSVVAVEHGGELERSLVFRRRLPDWALDGVEPRVAARLPEAVERVLGPRPPGRRRARGAG
jgi:hypothetical protein